MAKIKNKKNSNCSRGYCGYFTTSKGETIYLRSMKEYIVATWLSSLENENVTMHGEWYIKGIYRPDFRIVIHDNIRLLIEVKDNEKTALEYIKKYKQLINDMGYRYIVIYKPEHFRKLIKKFNIDLEKWKEASEYDYSGENNPRYGMKATEETKQKIGDKTRERSKNPEYIEMVRQRHREGITDETKRLIGENTRKCAAIRRAKRELEDPIITVKCAYCGAEKQKRKSAVKEYEYCQGTQCTIPHRKLLGIYAPITKEESANRFKKSLVKQGKRVFDEYNEINSSVLQCARADGIIYKNSQLSIPTIEKYFITIENFLQEIQCLV